jgi:signal transduction histidine kinase
MTLQQPEETLHEPLLVRWGRYAARRSFLPRLVRAYARLAGGAGSLLEGPEAAPLAQARFATALRGAVHEGLPLIATGSAVFYTVLGLIALQRPELGVEVFAVAMASAWLSLAVRVAWGFDLIPQRWAHSVQGLMMMVLIAHALWRWIAFGGGQQGGLVGMALITAGSLSLSLPWSISLTVGGLLVWLAITLFYRLNWPDPFMSAFLVATPSVAAVVRLGRRAVIERMEQYRVRDLHQRAELRRAQRQLESKVRERTANLVAANDQLLREIAERTRVENELEEARRDLERRVAERTSEVSAINQALRKEIAERERAEEQMQQHREELAHTLRVQTVGQMMGSLAHELNQPLTAIANNVEACARYIDSGASDDVTLRGLLDQATSEALRAGSIVHHLRAFLEKRAPEVESGDLCELVRSVLDLLEPETRERKVQLVLDLKTESLPILGNRIQIEQVVVNLVRNAIDAVEETVDGAREVRVEVRPTPRDTGEVAVVDSGPGVDAERMRRVFEPFFTTKAHGLGLGLAISRSIVEAHHGRLWLEKRVDGCRGAAAIFELPISSGGE